ncbi:MAG: hypothetical protein A3B99_05445 [Candidatus Yanofskybacteria bacterium RIFCSPHIGHO2_02_FULL_44_12b]|uniref:Uncharacterized protein n=2 Tax=Candidatus Yanofskyibacteriota TaxID=1752733 RepID=A0A1F8GJ94_9BACT|nr:MAG: hypothetical protein UW79_C0028G0011 [Candidatus Yanofskybacteria bacterium GW2011_GWA2_44_9]OGN05152.1 MAG: hypothetical protein A2659_02340 [Candidatus Yanofskybacteria bacterium RIFCSPHIGHO2_01_FULL_44_24]OGN14586.1 MAG: hypothetical protein A3B99_05445 [Candidatus Yanofskybacteria bacterium RIFCSPHIGHO2_02_FULL_44_12b]OGN25472.1 MAG: hypothetical protein A2925_01940 [Candidatus Yanofskybacteria bacterium RIFCSPLOWO2_01_FULL_44_22]
MLKLDIFFKELILFAGALSLGIFTAYSYSFLVDVGDIQPVSFSWRNMLIYLGVFLAVSFILFRFKSIARWMFRFFLVLVVFSGSQVVFGIFMSAGWALISSLAMTAVFMFFRNVLVHNLGIILGVAGISSILGISISPQAGVTILVVLSFYDIIAVYATRHMVHMARGMVESGAIFGFVIPFDFKDFLAHQSTAREKIGERFMILGSGDIGLPIIMVSSLAPISIRASIITGAFALTGVFLTHLIFINQSQKRAMAALPPIATMTIIGYLVSLI